MIFQYTCVHIYHHFTIIIVLLSYFLKILYFQTFQCLWRSKMHSILILIAEISLWCCSSICEMTGENWWRLLKEVSGPGLGLFTVNLLSEARGAVYSKLSWSSPPVHCCDTVGGKNKIISVNFKCSLLCSWWWGRRSIVKYHAPWGRGKNWSSENLKVKFIYLTLMIEI